MDLSCLDLKDKYAFLAFSGFDITLSSPMAWVHSNIIRKNTRKLHLYIPCIYMVYTMYTQALGMYGIYMVYTWYIPCILFIGVSDGVSCHSVLHDGVKYHIV